MGGGHPAPLRSLTSQMLFLLNAKRREADDGQLGSEAGSLPYWAHCRGCWEVTLTQSQEAGGWGSRGPLGPTSREHSLPVRPSPQGPRADIPPRSDPDQAARALWGGFSQRPVQPLGRCRKSWRPALQCIASGHPGVPVHRKEVLVALVVSKGTGQVAPWWGDRKAVLGEGDTFKPREGQPSSRPPSHVTPLLPHLWLPLTGSTPDTRARQSRLPQASTPMAASSPARLLS